MGDSISGEQQTLHHTATDLSGRRVGSLTVVKPSGYRKDRHIGWLCVCDCGREKVIASNSLVRKNPTKSCGCVNARTAKKRWESSGKWSDNSSYDPTTGEKCYRNRAAWSKAVLRIKGNGCEFCGWAEARCDVHHKTPKAAGGLHTVSNAVVLCPNCHRVEHEQGRGD